MRLAQLRIVVGVFPALAIALAPLLYAQQAAPQPSAARILLLPKRVVSGERATLAVLDVNGRLTPGVRIDFSDGDHVTTDTTGRAHFVAPLNVGVISAAIPGRPGKVYAAVVSPEEASSSTLEIASVPQFASLSDRFELSGKGFCGDADANQLTVGAEKGLVLAASPVQLAVLPPEELDAGPASVQVKCANRGTVTFSVTFLALSLHADSSPVAPGDHRTLIVRVRGTSAKVSLEASNLAPDIAQLAGGKAARVATSGGAENVARFELTGLKRGHFIISIRLVSSQAPPHLLTPPGV